MHEPNPQLEHDQIDLLLPWFVNDTLETDERRRVQRHIESCPACRDSKTVLEEIRRATLANAAVPMVPEPRSADLMAAIDIERKVTTRQDWWPKLAIAASVLALALGAVVFLDYADRTAEPEARFETATSQSGGASIDFVMAVEFESGTTTNEREQVFERFGTVDFIPGAAPGSYRVLVRLPAVSLEELERLTEEIESHANVRSATIEAVQLPMR